MLCFALKKKRNRPCPIPHFCLNPATFFLSFNFLALPFPSSLSSTSPPQGFPLLLSWPPAAHCEVGSRLQSRALTALLSLALMQVDSDLTPTAMPSGFFVFFVFSSIPVPSAIFHSHLFILRVLKMSHHLHIQVLHHNFQTGSLKAAI